MVDYASDLPQIRTLSFIRSSGGSSKGLPRGCLLLPCLLSQIAARLLRRPKPERIHPAACLTNRMSLSESSGRRSGEAGAYRSVAPHISRNSWSSFDSAQSQAPHQLIVVVLAENSSLAMNISLSTLAILLVGIGVVAKVLWTLYLSPLARQRIPGPKRAAVSDLWDYWMQFRGCRTFVVHDLFEVSLILLPRCHDGIDRWCSAPWSCCASRPKPRRIPQH